MCAYTLLTFQCQCTDGLLIFFKSNKLLTYSQFCLPAILMSNALQVLRCQWSKCTNASLTFLPPPWLLTFLTDLPPVLPLGLPILMSKVLQVGHCLFRYLTPYQCWCVMSVPMSVRRLLAYLFLKVKMLPCLPSNVIVPVFRRLAYLF